MSKIKIALTTIIFVAIVYILPLVLLLAFASASEFYKFVFVFGLMFFGAIGFLFAMLLKTKADIKEQIEEIKVQNAAIAYKLTELKKQGVLSQPVNNDNVIDEKKDKKEKFDDFQ